MLDWTVFGEYENVDVIVCSAVIREIDNLKARRNDYAGARARKVHSMFTAMIEECSDQRLLRADRPRVSLCLQPALSPDPALEPPLDYSKPDHEIAGCLGELRNKYSSAAVLLISRDAGPVFAARGCNLPAEMAPKEWVAPRTNSPDKKRISELESEIARLRAGEPQFEVQFFDHHGRGGESVIFDKEEFLPLTEGQLDALINRLRKSIPPAQHEQEPLVPEAERQVSIASGTFDRVYVRPNKMDWEKYLENDYPSWLKECRDVLETLNKSLSIPTRPLKFCFKVLNKGTRPAKHVLVKIKAKGSLKLIRPGSSAFDKAEESLASKETLPQLPPPPPAPAWKWILKLTNHHDGVKEAKSQHNEPQNGLRDVLSSLDLNAPFKQIGRFAAQDRELLILNMPDFVDRMRPVEEPDAFYWRDTPSDVPAPTLKLQCKHWRHNVKLEEFGGLIAFDPKEARIKGAVEFEIHAENLSEPIKKKIKVRISKQTSEVTECANRLVDDLIHEHRK